MSLLWSFTWVLLFLFYKRDAPYGVVDLTGLNRNSENAVAPILSKHLAAEELRVDARADVFHE